jgi:hypothetical protein
VAGGEGFGSVGEGLAWGVSVQCLVGLDGVVVGGEIVELGSQFGDGSSRWVGRSSRAVQRSAGDG